MPLNRWNDAEAALLHDPLDLRVYSSRLLGMDKSLVMHGGGNTSVKMQLPDLFGNMRELLYIKGSGWDLETIERTGFAPVLMDAMLQLATLTTLSDTAMANALRVATVESNAPSPSVEAILHAVLPYVYVDHTRRCDHRADQYARWQSAYRACFW